MNLYTFVGLAVVIVVISARSPLQTSCPLRQCWPKGKPPQVYEVCREEYNKLRTCTVSTLDTPDICNCSSYEITSTHVNYAYASSVCYAPKCWVGGRKWIQSNVRTCMYAIRDPVFQYKDGAEEAASCLEELKADYAECFAFKYEIPYNTVTQELIEATVKHFRRVAAGCDVMATNCETGPAEGKYYIDLCKPNIANLFECIKIGAAKQGKVCDGINGYLDFIFNFYDQNGIFEDRCRNQKKVDEIGSSCAQRSARKTKRGFPFAF